MPSSISSSDRVLHRLTASDRPGVAQPVPRRDVPAKPWPAIAACVLVAVLLLSGLWEWRMRQIGLVPGDLGDDPSAWAEQRRRVDNDPNVVAIVGDSRILFDTDLDRFQQLTGIRPVQLALAGTAARPFLEDLAADSKFRGLAIVGITELSYFRPGAGRGGAALKRWHWESPAQRSSLLLDRLLRRKLAMLDPGYRFSGLVARLDPDWRAGVQGPYDDVWKLAVMSDGRQTWLWPEIERNAVLRNHARSVWLGMYRMLKAPPAQVGLTDAQTQRAVARIRARGGDVVFVRPPSAPQLRSIEERTLPRAKGWDALLRVAQVEGVHFDDMPNAQGLVMPELSHLTRACARVFTDAYVRALAARTPRLRPRLRLRPDAPASLLPASCITPIALPGG